MSSTAPLIVAAGATVNKRLLGIVAAFEAAHRTYEPKHLAGKLNVSVGIRHDRWGSSM